MNKLYAGIAATALAAAGLACGTGSASATATSPWPTDFRATQIVTAASGDSFVLGSYDTDQTQTLDDGTSFAVPGQILVKVSNGDVSTIDLGDGASPTAIAAHGDTVYAVGTVSTVDSQDSTVWTIAAATGTAVAATSPVDGPQTVAVSPDGSRLGISSGAVADVVSATDGQVTASTALGANGYFAYGAFSPDGDSYYVAANDNVFDEAESNYSQTSVDLWSLPSDAGSTSVTPLTLVTSSDYNDYPGPVVVGDNGDVYVVTGDGDDAIRVVRDGAVTAVQSTNGGAGSLALSHDDKTLYAAVNGTIEAFGVASLGGYDNENDGSSYAPTYQVPATVAAATVTADGTLLAAETEYSNDTNDVAATVVDTVTAPGAPTNVSAEREDTYAVVAFTPPSSTGSSAWTSTDPDADDTAITYTITLHDTTDATKQDITSDSIAYTSDLYIGDEAETGEAPLVPGDSYTVSVTATNGLFTGPAGTYSLPAYTDSATGSTGNTGGTGSAGGNTGTGGTEQGNAPTPAAQTPAAPAQVATVTAAPIKSTAKKLTLTLAGVTTVPGKVKVYDGKKLIGTATVKNGKLTLKLKKHLAKGKHKITVKYAGSAQVSKFNKKVKLKVK